jgi:hypothetical protein
MNLRHQSLADWADRYRHSAFTLASFFIYHIANITRYTCVASSKCMYIITRATRLACNLLGLMNGRHIKPTITTPVPHRSS